MSIRFDGQVAIVTGAGGGLGKSHALALAARGAKVVVNDLGGSVDGTGGSSAAAEAVVAEIKAAGGEAIADGANVCDMAQVEAMVKKAMDTWGRVDILINNAGVLRDVTFAKMDVKDFDFVMQVHVMGSVNCTKAVWEIMREQQYGRIVMTTSSSGLYGNFGQSNYGAAKMALVGFMNTLCLEGGKYNIHVNSVAPFGATRMTENLLPEEVLKLSTPEAVTAGVLTLCDKDAPNRVIMCAGAGGYARAVMYETDGIYLKPEDQTPENVRAAWAELNDPAGQQEFIQGGQQGQKYIAKAVETLGLKM